MIATMPERHEIEGAHGSISFLEAGQGEPLVLLHGIGACASAWGSQLAHLSREYRVIAWDAPGYGRSAPLATMKPHAEKYADALACLLSGLQITRPHVIGHSLGAIMATAWAARCDADARSLILASPARGYGACEAQRRNAIYLERVDMLAELGVDGLAGARSSKLCSPGANEATLQRVRENMKQITPIGYQQAAYLLSHASIADFLPSLRLPVAVLCGAEDAVTTVQACTEVAASLNTALRILPHVGHACYVEAPDAFDAAVLDFLQNIKSNNHD